jgi:hypothetical protein
MSGLGLKSPVTGKVRLPADGDLNSIFATRQQCVAGRVEEESDKPRYGGATSRRSPQKRDGLHALLFSLSANVDRCREQSLSGSTRWQD